MSDENIDGLSFISEDTLHSIMEKFDANKKGFFESSIITVKKTGKHKAHLERMHMDSKIKLSIDFEKDWLESFIDTKSDILDKNLAKFARLLEAHLHVQQEGERPDFHGTGRMLACALHEIIKERKMHTRFLRGKSIFTNGKCSTLFSVFLHPQYPVGALDIKMMGEGDHRLDENLEDFLYGFVRGAPFHANVIIEKVEDKRDEWDSTFESMAGSILRILNG